MTTKRVEILLSDDDQELLASFKKRIGIDKDPGAIKEALAIASHSLLSGDNHGASNDSQTLQQKVEDSGQILLRRLGASGGSEGASAYNPDFEL